MKKFRLLFIVLLACAMQVQAQQMRVKILATGGTIAGSGAAADRAAYTAGALPIQQLLGAVPEIHKLAQVTGEQIASVGSQDMSVEIWLKLAKRINEIFKNNEADAIVITHGTDTQEETAYFLSLTVKYDRPVVLTGSMRPATGISADGPKNLFDAVVVAAAPESQNRGVMVSFNEQIYSGRDVVKTHTTSLDAFHSPNHGTIGVVYDGMVKYYYTPDHKTNSATPFYVDKLSSLPKVDIVYMYADAAPTAIQAFANNRSQGIVIAGVGNGNFNKVFYDEINKTIKKGITVCRATRCSSGRVLLHDEVNDDELGTIVSDDLNPQKARILLMLALTQTHNRRKLQEYFFHY
jgi:L-asparaginase